jgi:hypothetical protein
VSNDKRLLNKITGKNNELEMAILRNIKEFCGRN